MLDPRLDRRTFLRRSGGAAGLLLAPGLLAACGGDDPAPSGGAKGGDPLERMTSRSCVFAEYGGETRAAREKVFSDPFTKATGVRVRYADADSARFVLQARRGRGDWDAYDAVATEMAHFVEEDLLQKLPSDVPRAPIVDQAYRDYGSGGVSFSWQIGYSTETYSGRKPESWADFWDVDRFPGRRAYPRYHFGTLEPALMADGVAPDDLYPLDFERAYAKLDELRPHLVFYETYAEAQQMLVSGNVPMAHVPNSRVFQLKQKGAKVEAVWNQALFSWGAPAVAKGAEHADAMFGFIYWCCDPARQAEFFEVSGVGPTVNGVEELLKPDLKGQLPTARANLDVAARVNTQALAEIEGDYTKGWADWLAS